MFIRRISQVITALFLLGFLLYPARQGSSQPDAAPGQAAGAEFARLEGQALITAAALFEEQCGVCHEPDGASDIERLNLIDEVWHHGDTLDAIEKTIREGVDGTLMKGQEGNLSDEQIKALAKYVKMLAPHEQPQDIEEPPAPPAAMPEPQAMPGLVSLRVYPDSPTLWGADAAQRFVVVGSFVDGLDRDVTARCRFSVSAPDLVGLDEFGRITARADGELQLTAALAGHAAETTVRIEGNGERRPFSFQRDIGGILTEAGCNASDCHGGVKGRGGFKLSINALHPRNDYDWIVQGGGFQVLTDEVEGERIPRINKEEPEKSLLLTKPTFEVEHEGGKLLSKDSAEYAALLDWIRNGTPYTDEGSESTEIERVEVFPGEAVLEPDGTHQLLVTAYLANGRREDITDQVHFESNNREVLRAKPGGLVEAGSRGETDVIVRAPGHIASARIGVISELIADYPDVPSNNFIDDHVFAKLRRYHILPSERCNDSEFVRRVCLDITGTLPPPSRVREFIADDDPQKREKLIDILLDSPEYDAFWTFRVADLLRVSSSATDYWEWVRKSVASNKPYDQIARERLAAQGHESPTRFYITSMKVLPMQNILAEDVRVFMGRRMDCAECHDHPWDTWSQDEFWGVAAFYSRLTSTEWIDNMVVYDDSNGQEIDHGVDGIETLRYRKPTHPRTKERVEARFIDGTPLPGELEHDPRLALAGLVTSHPYFDQAIVNRMWSFFFGRGFVDPVDDFSSTNLPSHPELLDALAADFRENGHDLKHLIRLMANSRTYQLAGSPNASNKDDDINYSWSRPRTLEAEVLLDAITRVTGVAPVFEQTVAMRKAPPGTRAIQLKTPAAWPSRFLEIYDRPLRRAVPERSDQPSLQQAMHILVGDTYTEKLSVPGSRIERLIKGARPNREVVEDFYLAALARFPTEEEHAAIEAMFGERSPIATNPFFTGTEVRREVLEDLVWALISSRVFAYNH